MRADGHRDRRAGVRHRLAAHQTFGGVHRDAADGVLTEVLRDLEHEAVALVVGFERVQDRRQMILEGDVDDGADHLTDLAGRAGRRCADCRRLGGGSSGRRLRRGCRRLGDRRGLLGGSCSSHRKNPLQCSCVAHPCEGPASLAGD
jgi:hypothetical protein